MDAWLGAQREAEKRKRDQELSQESKAAMAVAYYRTVHDLECVGLGELVTGSAGLASAPIIPKPIAAGSTANTSMASIVLGSAQIKLARRLHTPMGMPGTSSFAWMQSANVGRIAGRYLPYIGTAAGAATAYACLGSNP